MTYIEITICNLKPFNPQYPKEIFIRVIIEVKYLTLEAYILQFFFKESSVFNLVKKMIHSNFSSLVMS